MAFCLLIPFPVKNSNESKGTLPYTLIEQVNIATKTNKLDRLKADGWKVGNAEDFLQLSDEKAQLIELKLSLISAHRNHVILNKAIAG